MSRAPDPPPLKLSDEDVALFLVSTISSLVQVADVDQVQRVVQWWGAQPRESYLAFKKGGTP